MERLKAYAAAQGYHVTHMVCEIGSGRLLPASQWEIAVTETPTCSANAACVNTASSRNCRNVG
jgi:hypothetical protein